MIKNLFILGCGRSGTSLVTGLFRNSGYYMGDRLYPPRDSNPLGFFEDAEVNSINENLLIPFFPRPFAHQGIQYGLDSPGKGHSWLARLDPDMKPVASVTDIERIRKLILQTPFCFKDPRFCYTLPIWLQENTSARFLCIFRHPAEVVCSILKEVHSMPYLFNFAISVNQVFEVWRLMYQRILDQYPAKDDWLFLYYDDLFCSSTLDRISEFAGTSVDRSFPQPQLKRSTASIPLDKSTELLFQALMQRSEQI
ncbi:MAG: sulfotransferase [Methylococcaceae bacterium]